MLTVSSAKLTGTPGSSGWAQVHDFTPEDPEKITARGHLFAIVATTRVEDTPGSLDTISAGRELISRLHEEYFGDLSLKPFNALSHAVDKVSKEFKESWGNVEIVASAFVEGIVYSAACGGGKVLICRNGAIGTILTSADVVVSASGFPKPGDTLLMGTKTFFENETQGVIKAALTSGNPSFAVESFAPMVHGSGNLGNLGIAVIKFEEKTIFTPEPVTIGEETVKKSFDIKNSVLGIIKSVADRMPKKNVYVKTALEEEAVSQSKKLTFSVALILLLILAVSVGFGIRQKTINDTKNKYQGLLADASGEVDQAISLASVSPERSRELFVDSEQKLNQIQALKVSDPKIDALAQKIDDSRAAVLGEYLATPQQFLDLSLLSSGFNGDVITASGGSIYILDKTGDRLVSVAIGTKKSKVVAGPSQINSPQDLAAYEDRAFVLMADGIYEVGDSKSKVIDKTWSGDAFIKAFAGNMYVLDKAGNAVYRFPGQGNSFGDKGNWLSASTRANFADVKSWVIDGSVYVLYPNSKILKYSLGSPQSFTVNGVLPEIGTIDAVYADADNQNIYLLDRAGKRVVITDKKGKYIAQYIDDSIANATNLVVSEADKKIILLNGDKLYSMDLK